MNPLNPLTAGGRGKIRPNKKPTSKPTSKPTNKPTSGGNKK